MLKRLAIVAVTAAALAWPAAAQDTTGPKKVISDQIAAFLADDVGTAFSYASPGIQRLFETPENFGRMVEEGYPMVWRPAEVLFLDQRQEGGALVQRVMITDMAGTVHVLDYQMIETGDGWEIGGVQILQAPGVGA